MIHVLKTAPLVEPVTLAEMRSHLGITQDADISRDNIITGRIISARMMAESYCRKAFVTQTLTGYAVDFPHCWTNLHRIPLKAPLQSVTSINYLNVDTGASQILAAPNYYVDVVSACVIPVYETQWPDARSILNSVRVEYISGYGLPAAVPETIKDAIRFIVAQWEVFQSSMEGVMRPFTMPNAAKELLQNECDMRNYL